MPETDQRDPAATDPLAWLPEAVMAIAEDQHLTDPAVLDGVQERFVSVWDLVCRGESERLAVTKPPAWRGGGRHRLDESKTSTVTLPVVVDESTEGAISRTISWSPQYSDAQDEAPIWPDIDQDPEPATNVGAIIEGLRKFDAAVEASEKGGLLGELAALDDAELGYLTLWLDTALWQVQTLVEQLAPHVQTRDKRCGSRMRKVAGMLERASLEQVVDVLNPGPDTAAM